MSDEIIPQNVPHNPLIHRQWQDGRRGQDGWGRYTRRRKWFRDAELVELNPDTETPIQGVATDSEKSTTKVVNGTVDTQDDAAGISHTSPISIPRKRRWFGSSKDVRSSTSLGSVSSITTNSEDTASLAGENPLTQTSSKPINIRNSRSPPPNITGLPGKDDTYSSSPGRLSGSSSRNQKRRNETPGSSGDGDSQNTRNREIEEAQDQLNRWGARATDGTERAEREMGLGDDVNMGLS
jgi:hypothetical protein